MVVKNFVRKPFSGTNIVMQDIFRKFLAQKTHDLSHDLRHENLSMKFE